MIISLFHGLLLANGSAYVFVCQRVCWQVDELKKRRELKRKEKKRIEKKRKMRTEAKRRMSEAAHLEDQENENENENSLPHSFSFSLFLSLLFCK